MSCGCYSDSPLFISYRWQLASRFPDFVKIDPREPKYEVSTKDLKFRPKTLHFAKITTIPQGNKKRRNPRKTPKRRSRMSCGCYSDFPLFISYRWQLARPFPDFVKIDQREPKYEVSTKDLKVSTKDFAFAKNHSNSLGKPEEEKSPKNP